MLLFVITEDIVSPSSSLHKQHHVAVGRNILESPLPLVGVPVMLSRHYFYFLDGLRVLLLKELVSNDSRKHMARDVPGRSGKGR